MNAPVQIQQLAAASFGDTDMVRHDLYGALHIMRCRVESAMLGIESGDDFDVLRSMKHLAAHLNYGLELVALIEAEKARDRERRQAADRRQPRGGRAT
ncbi:hypothetical protein [Methylobacterium oxalidis]|uniref:Uncharacterized protein n=1 Tax=Methylobacterium oxalidis TaxID=944322 RepID=A0A512J9J6_9HYPH|nr:hypothetical protein [Methylobacterium oxalidis]GEP06622.1 hypothetical protein MOX02_46600 [Methylobacterium oxalidis]GJE35397.1 hypothetical protein LDDCCGHA_5615 [Methylobacterium oxalidis]GLS66236.1 hypothetical protein GCM10007888_46180 [Methylobacterium oxalidis]